ncbi:hypothetical protein HRbin36_02133 [bacterium HR36]|nr:hypothetical protein HRbin36_02133 [bacterium HR36]
MKHGNLLLFAIGLALAFALLSVFSSASSQEQGQEKAKPKPGTVVDKDKAKADVKPKPKPTPIPRPDLGKAKPDSTTPPPKLSPEEIRKAEAIENELLKALPPAPQDPELRRVILDGDEAVTLKKLVPVPIPHIPKPCVITAGDVDNFSYNPKTDTVTPCCLGPGAKIRNFDEPGVNKLFAHQVRIPCCKILAIRCEVRIRNEGELSYNDGLYISLPGKPCQTVWSSSISGMNKAWPGAYHQVFTLTWWLPPAAVQQINRYIFEAPGCECFLCLTSQDDHAVDYWRLYVYCCECPTARPPLGAAGTPEGSVTK